MAGAEIRLKAFAFVGALASYLLVCVGGDGGSHRYIRCILVQGNVVPGARQRAYYYGPYI